MSSWSRSMRIWMTKRKRRRMWSLLLLCGRDDENAAIHVMLWSVFMQHMGGTINNKMEKAVMSMMMRVWWMSYFLVPLQRALMEYRQVQFWIHRFDVTEFFCDDKKQQARECYTRKWKVWRSTSDRGGIYCQVHVELFTAGSTHDYCRNEYHVSLWLFSRQDSYWH